MKVSAGKIKMMTSGRTRALGESPVFVPVKAQNWFRGDRSYRLAGFDRRKDLDQFNATWSDASGGVGRSRLGIPLKLALECGGDRTQSIVLH